MDTSVYEAEAAVESFHWWFEGRRTLFRRILRGYALAQSSTILDAGTGTGANLSMLADLGYTSIVGLDFSADAVKFCARKGFSVRQGSLEALPFENEAFDFCLATDVIEHVDDDVKALQEIARVLKDGGKVLITVPAFQALWGSNDDRAHHRRRYVQQDLLDRIDRAGLKVVDSYYFNYLLFLPIWMVRRMVGRNGSVAKNESEINSPALNAILERVFKFDVWSAERVRPPFGVSILAVAEKRDRQ